ncbi:MAG: hypothetical protein LBI57_04590 [Helicobacteraceae bacterium]|jgi:hypothetical protein|nr:hypothetical protein [Helicobacteraceae bacterium]
MKKVICFLIAFLFIEIRLFAVAVSVDYRNVTFSDAGGAFSNPAVLAVGAAVRYRLTAQVSGSYDSNDNWGCTEVETGGIIRARDHGDWRSGSHQISATENDFAPQVAGTYDVRFYFYGGGIRNGRCSGAFIGTYDAANAIVTRTVDLDVLSVGFGQTSSIFNPNVIVHPKATFYYRISAKVLDRISQSGNWGCTEVEVDGAINTYNHWNWTNGTQTYVRDLHAFAPQQYGVYDADFRFYIGEERGGRCSGAQIGSHFVKDAVTVSRFVIDIIGAGFSNGNDAFVKSIVLPVGSTLRYRLSASPKYSSAASENWGCTEAQISQIKRFYNHDNWRDGASRAITSWGDGVNALSSGISLKAPSVAGTYDVTFRLYSGDSKNGRCGGAFVGEYVAPNAVTTTGHISFRPTFDLYYRKSLIGDMKVIGASAMCIPEEKERTNDNVGVCQDPQFKTIFENMNLKYVYVDSYGRTVAHPSTSRTAAYLNLPAGAKIVYAKLYWMGRLAKDYEKHNGGELNCPNASYTSDPAILNALKAGPDRVKFEKPSGDTRYIDAEQIYLETYDGNCAYLAQADVTNIVDQDAASGTYYVGEIKSRRNGGPFGAFGGWALVTVFENPSDLTSTYRLITLFDGWRGGNDVIYTLISGFITPAAGEVKSTLFVMGADGDSDPGDRMCINAENSWCNTGDKYRSGIGEPGAERLIFPYRNNNTPIQHHAFDGFRNNFYINAFLSTVSEGPIGFGVEPVGQLPKFTDDYVLGFDLHTYYLDGFLANGATQTNIIVEPGGDHIVFGALGFATVIYNPYIANIKINSSVTYRPDAPIVCDGKKDMRGAKINYVYELENSGREPAERITIYTDFAETGLDKYIASVSTAIMMKEGNVSYNAPICASSVKGILCNVDYMDITRLDAPTKVSVLYSVTLKQDIPLVEDDIDLEVRAHARYYNAITGEKIETEATNIRPAVAGKLCANETCKTLAKRGKPNGYYLIDPDWGRAMQPFEAYCDNMNKTDYLSARTYLPLAMTTDFSNLRFKTIKNGDYYHKDNQIDKTRFGAIRLNDDYTVHADDEIIKNGFSNINLSGTPFAIDFAKTAIATCSAFKKAHFDQIVKIDAALDKTNLFCTALNGKIQLKQVAGDGKFGKFEFDKVDSYRHSKFANGFNADPINPEKNSPYPYKSCLAIKNAKSGVPAGFYYVNPEANRDVGTNLLVKDPNKHRPFVVFCDMRSAVTGAKDAPTIQLALDGDVTTSADDLARNRDTCSKLGMYMFVPINKTTFNKTRDHLRALKSEWSPYMGSVRYNLSQLWSASGGGGMGNDELRAFWPYGPFGLFNKKNGGGENSRQFADGSTSGAGLPLNSTNGMGASSKGGWQTIFKDMPDSSFGDGFPKADKDDWWLSDKGCNALKKHGYQDGWDLCSSDVAYNENGCYLHDPVSPEPNGDYAAKQWLYYVADNNGDVYACNDKSVASHTGWKTDNGGGATYVYAHYTCMTADSFAKSGASNPLPENFGGWDETLDINSEPPALYTKMAKQPIAIQAVPQGAIKQFDGQLCATIAYRDQIAPVETPTSAKIGATSASATDFTAAHVSGGVKYACVKINSQTDLALTPITFIWRDGAQTASKDANVTLLAYDCADLNNVVACESKSYDGGRFSVRPIFKVDSNYYETLISAVDYPKEAPLPNGGFAITATRGYTQQADNTPVPCDGGDGLCVIAVDKKPVEYGVLDANITFENGKAQINKLSYDDAGEISLKLIDKDWTKIDTKRDYGGAYSGVEKYKNDCIPDSDAPTLNNVANPPNSPYYGKIGCVTGGDLSEITLKVIPDRFRINAFEVEGVFADPYTPLGGGKSSFTYYANELDGHFASANLKAEAINKKGSTTKNYGEGNYSKNADYEFDFPSLALKTDDMPADVKARFWRRVADKNGSLSADANIRAERWKLGEADLEFGFNFARDYVKALPVFFMSAGSAYKGYDFNFSIKDEDSVRGEANWDESASAFSEINFVYGRAFVADATSRDDGANVTFSIDYFSDRGSNGIRREYRAPSPLASSVGWFRLGASADKRTEANVTANITGSAEQGSKSAITNDQFTTFAYPFSERRPRRFVSHLGAPPYLWYHPFGKPYADVRGGEEETRKGCFEHPCGTIEFEARPIEGWGGSGDRDDSRYYDDNSTRERAPLRLGR